MVYTDLHIRLLILQDIEMCFWRGSLLAWAELDGKKTKQTSRPLGTRTHESSPKVSIILPNYILKENADF